MKNILLALFIIISLPFSQWALGQTSDCVISAGQFVSLAGAGQDKAENILGGCFTYNGIDENGESSRLFRRNYGTQDPNYWDYYDIFNVYINQKKASLGTTNYSVYLKYKNALKNYGFRLDYENENTATSYYKYGNYKMITLSAKNANDKLAYVIIVFIEK